MDPVQRYRVDHAKRDHRALYAELCLHYPQYSLEQAQDMPVGDVNLLVNYARLERAETFLQLLGIVVSSDKANFGKTSTALTNQVAKLRGLL